MIRINLLPVPKARKSQALLIQVAAGLIFLAVLAFVCFMLGKGKEQAIATVNQEIANKNRAIEELKAQVGEVEKYKQQAQVLEEQLSVIKALEAGRSGPVKMMDELTEIIPKKLWITSFKESGKRLTLEGVADSGPVIADFMEALKTSKYFQNPQLNVVNGAEMEGQKLHRFTLNLSVRYDI